MNFVPRGRADLRPLPGTRAGRLPPPGEGEGGGGGGEACPELSVCSLTLQAIVAEEKCGVNGAVETPSGPGVQYITHENSPLRNRSGFSSKTIAGCVVSVGVRYLVSQYFLT